MKKSIVGLLFLAVFLAASIGSIIAAIPQKISYTSGAEKRSLWLSGDQGGSQKPFVMPCGDEGGPSKPFNNQTGP